VRINIPICIKESTIVCRFSSTLVPSDLLYCQRTKHYTSFLDSRRAFENRVLRRIFGPKRDEVTGEWRKLQSEELHILYSSPNIIRQIKSRRMRWAGHVARMGEQMNVYRVSMGNPEGKNHLEDQGVDGKMGSEWILGRLAGRV
jgi:hypothetical protein